MKRYYDRSSTPCRAVDLDPQLRERIAEHAEPHHLGEVLADAVACCDTRNVRLYQPTLLNRLKGLRDPDPEHRTVALFTARYFVVAVAGQHRGVHVRSARLDSITLEKSIAERLTNVPAAKLPQDSGFSVTGTWSGGAPNSGASFYVGVGDDEAGSSFRDALTQAIIDAKAT